MPSTRRDLIVSGLGLSASLAVGSSARAAWLPGVEAGAPCSELFRISLAQWFKCEARRVYALLP